MDNEKQVKISKFAGMVIMIARKTGYNKDFVSRVLNGKVNSDTPGGRKIKALAMRITENIEAITIDDE